MEISRLRSQHSGCEVIVCGDRNDMKIEDFLLGNPTLRQIALHNTNKKKDIVVTHLYAGYQEPVLLPAVLVDPGRPGVLSDHARVEVKPRTNLSNSKARPKKDTFMVQRIPDSLVSAFWPVLLDDKLSYLKDGMLPEELVEAFQTSVSRLVDQNFPKKIVSVTHEELPYFTEVLS